MILDAGHIGVSSSLADKAEVRQMQSKKGQALTDDDFHKLEGLMYDEFSLKLESTQVRAGIGNAPFLTSSLKTFPLSSCWSGTDWMRA